MANEKVQFSYLSIDDVEGGEFASAWFIGNMDKITKRKYGKNLFSDLYNKVHSWVWDNRDRIRGMKLEEQEELMIAEGVITRDDI